MSKEHVYDLNRLRLGLQCGTIRLNPKMHGNVSVAKNIVKTIVTTSWRSVFKTDVKELGEVRIMRETFRGDLLSLLLFTIIMVSLALFLSKVNPDYKLTNDQKQPII